MSVTTEQLLSLAESYAYDRWPEQTVQDEPDLLDLSREKIKAWLIDAKVEVTP